MIGLVSNLNRQANGVRSGPYALFGCIIPTHFGDAVLATLRLGEPISSFELLGEATQRFAFAKHGRCAGVDSVWEQKKLEARKMLENGDESYQSSAYFVGQLHNSCSFWTSLSIVRLLRFDWAHVLV